MGRPVERGKEEKVFPGPATFGGPRHRSKILTEKGVPDGFILTSNMHKIQFRPRLCPNPAEGAYDAPQTLSRMVRGHPAPSPRFFPLDAFGISISATTE